MCPFSLDKHAHPCNTMKHLRSHPFYIPCCSLVVRDPPLTLKLSWCTEAKMPRCCAESHRVRLTTFPDQAPPMADAYNCLWNVHQTYLQRLLIKGQFMVNWSCLINDERYGSWWQTTWFMLVPWQSTKQQVQHWSRPCRNQQVSLEEPPLMVYSPVSCERLPEVGGSSSLIRWFVSVMISIRESRPKVMIHVSIIFWGVTERER